MELSLVSSKKGLQDHARLEMIVLDLRRFCENNDITKNNRFSSISVSIFMKYMELLMHHVETKIKKILPEKVSLDFDR